MSDLPRFTHVKMIKNSVLYFWNISVINLEKIIFRNHNYGKDINNFLDHLKEQEKLRYETVKILLLNDTNNSITKCQEINNHDVKFIKMMSESEFAGKDFLNNINKENCLNCNDSINELKKWVETQSSINVVIDKN